MNAINGRINNAVQTKALNYAEQAQKAREKNNAQLASGKRLTSASVDPAAMAIVEKMIGQINGLNQASRNVQDGISMMQTAEGAMSGIGDITQRLNELTVQASNGTYNDDDRQALQAEADQLVEEINSMAGRAEFNAKPLLDGSLNEANGGVWIQDGANAGQGSNMYINGMTADDLGIAKLDLTGSEADISAQLGDLQNALSMITDERARMGSYINTMEYTSDSLGVASENLEAAKSRLADADMAKSAMDSVKAGIMGNVSISMMRNMMKDAYSMRSTLLDTMGMQ